jgi:hypothetical protein
VDVSDAERKSWEVERNAWSRSHGELMESLELEKANLEKVKKQLFLLQNSQAAPENAAATRSACSPYSDQSVLITQLQQKLEAAIAQIHAQEDASVKLRRELAIALDKEMVKNTRMTEKVSDLEAALQKERRNKGKTGEDKIQILSQKMATFEVDFEAERKAFEDTRKVWHVHT